MTQTTEPHGFRVGDPVESTTLELGTIKGNIVELIHKNAVVIEDANGNSWGATATRSNSCPITKKNRNSAMLSNQLISTPKKTNANG
jgi:hypothetical protein